VDHREYQVITRKARRKKESILLTGRCLLPEAGSGAYVAAKHGVIGLTKTAAIEHAHLVFASTRWFRVGPNANDKGLGLAAASLVGLGFRHYGRSSPSSHRQFDTLGVRAMIDRPERSGSH
jgi:NAD(P)-dependent dehydrogenase (short-subunit alcohol dehydrogenase family)